MKNNSFSLFSSSCVQQAPRMVPSLLVAAACLGFLSSPVQAESFNWTGGAGNNKFTDAGNWDVEGAYPNAAEDAANVFNGDQILLNDAHVTLSELWMEYGQLNVGASVPTAGETPTAGASATIGSVMLRTSGDNQSGVLVVQANGAVDVAGTLEIAGGKLQLEQASGEGNLQSSVRAGSVNMSDGVIDISGGTLELYRFSAEANQPKFVMESGSLTVQDGGLLKVSGTEQHNFYAKEGTVDILTGGEIQSDKNIRFGTTGNLTLTMDNGKVTSGDRIYLGEDSGSATVTLTDSTIQSHYHFFIGSKAVANVTLNGNSALKKMADSADSFTIGNGTGANATVTLNDNSLIESGREFFVGAGISSGGSGGKGTLIMNDGSKVIVLKDGFTVGRDGAKGLLEMHGTSSAELRSEHTITIGQHGKSEGKLVMGDQAFVKTLGNFEIGRDGARGFEEDGSVPADAFGGLVQMSGGTFDLDAGTISENGSRIEIGKSLVFGSGGGKGRLEMSGASSLLVGENVYVGYNGNNTRGELVMRDLAKMEIGQNLTVGREGDDGTGYVTLSDYASINVGGNASFGTGSTRRTGYLTMYGNSKFDVTGNLSIGTGGDSSGGRGYAEIYENAAVTVGGLLNIGEWAGEGTFRMYNNATLEAGSIRIGHWWTNSDKILSITDDATVISHGETLIGSENAKGRLEMSGSSVFTAKGDVRLGYKNRSVGDAVIKMSGSSQLDLVGSARLVLGQEPGSGTGGGRVEMSESAVLTTAGGDVVLGQGSVGEFSVSDSAKLTVGGSGNLYLGGDATSAPGYLTPKGTLTVNGGEVSVAGGKILMGVGQGGEDSGLLLYQDSEGNLTTAVTDTPVMWNHDGDDGTPEVQRVTGSGTGVANLNGGVVTTRGFEKAASGSATVNFNGGTVKAAAASTDFFSGFVATDLVVGENGFSFDTNGHDVTFTNGLTGTGDLVKVGVGALMLEGNYAGFGGAVQVNEGSVVITEDAVLAIVLDGAKADALNPADADNLFVVADGASLTLEDGAKLQIVLNNLYSISEDGVYVFNIFSGDDITYNKDQIDLVTSFGSASYELLDNGQLQVTVTGIPEPSTYALWAGLGMAGLALARRRRR